MVIGLEKIEQGVALDGTLSQDTTSRGFCGRRSKSADMQRVVECSSRGLSGRTLLDRFLAGLSSGDS